MPSLCHENRFLFIIKIGTNYHNKAFVPRLALKDRLKGIRKWPIVIGFKTLLFHLQTCYRSVCYRTACYRKVCYRTVKQTNHIQDCSLNKPITFKVVV